MSDAPGVISARVDLMRHRAMVDYDPLIAEPRALVVAIQDAGYDSVLPRAGLPDSAGLEKTQNEHSGLKAAVTIAAGAAVMLFSMPLGMTASAQAGGLDRGPMTVLPWLYSLPQAGLRWVLLAVTGVIAVWAGRPIYVSAWKSLRHRETNMNTLVSLGTGVAFAYSAYGTVWPGCERECLFRFSAADSRFLITGQMA